MKSASRLILIMFALFIVALLTSCGSPDPKRSPDTFYRRDMSIEIDGRKYPGYGVLPAKDLYEITVRTKHDMDLFTASSCHRQIVLEKVADDGWFNKQAKFSFAYHRSSAIERDEACPLQLTGSADENEHSWGFLDFQTPEEKLPAILECDGWKATYAGVSICQAKAGLTQAILFSEPVLTSFDPGCSMPEPSDGKTFQFQIQRGRCTYLFASKSGAFHRLTTLGYDAVWMRGKR